MNTIIPIFYEKILTTDSLKNYFEGVNMTKQIVKFTVVLSLALGKNNCWNGRTIREIHKNLNITKKIYEDFMFNLRETLLEVNIDETLAD